MMLFAKKPFPLHNIAQSDQCIIRCVDCAHGILFCSLCDIQAHDQNPIHNREARNGNSFSPILATEAFDSQG